MLENGKSIRASTTASTPTGACYASAISAVGPKSATTGDNYDTNMLLFDGGEEFLKDVEDQTALEQSDGAVDLDLFPDFDDCRDWVSELARTEEFGDELEMEFPLLTQETEEEKNWMQFALPPLSPSRVQTYSLGNIEHTSPRMRLSCLNGDDAVEQSDDTTEEETFESEIELLEKEAKYLDAQKEFVESRAKNAHRVGIKEKRGVQKDIKQRLKLLKSQGENQLLHDLITQQQVYVESINAMLALSPVNEVRMTLMTPTESYIHLRKDFIERKRTILSLRQEKLDMTYKFIEHKSHGIDYNRPYQFSDMFDKFGKHYSIHFSISKYDDVSVFQVARAIYEQYAEDETLNRATGTSASRESFGTIRCNFMHQRIVSHVNGDSKVWKDMPEMESNDILICRFGENSAVLATDYVDKDDLYPYDTKNRIRRDTTTGVVLSGHADGDGKKFVVMKRFSMTKMHMHPHKVSQKLQNRFFKNMYNHDTMITLTIDRQEQNGKGCSCACAGNEMGCSCCAGDDWKASGNRMCASRAC